MPSLGISLILVSVGVMLVCVGIGLSRWRCIRGSSRLFILQAGMAACMESIGLLTSRGGGNNHVYFNVYVVAEFLVILFAARDSLKNAFVPLAIAGSLVVATVFTYDMIAIGPFFASFHAFSATWISLGTVYLIVLLRQILQNDPHRSRGLNVIAVMLITYYFCTIPRFGLLRYMVESISNDTAITINRLVILLSTIRYAGTAVGLWMIAKTSHRSAENAGPAPAFQVRERVNNPEIKA